LLDEVAADVSQDVAPTRRSLEATNILTVASAVLRAAAARRESRGCHRRTDVVAALDEWLLHLEVVLSDGRLDVHGGPGA
jgi:L-aspartate oxidase